MIADSHHLQGVSCTAQRVLFRRRPHRGHVEKTSAAMMDWTVVGCGGNELVGGDEIACPRCPTLGI